jgi:hypothetical protein
MYLKTMETGIRKTKEVDLLNIGLNDLILRKRYREVSRYSGRPR